MDTVMTWDESQFDQMSWHDNHVNGLRIRQGDGGGGEELDLDIDYILEWLQPDTTGSGLRFRLAPATLTFRNVSGLRVAVDYDAMSAALMPFSIGLIERRPVPGTALSSWTISLNWPAGHVTFDATGFQQALRVPAVISQSQVLPPAMRASLGA
jgi:hypothetical protein